MAKYFSVDWLAQSHRDITNSEESHGVGTDTALTHRPHIPCVVQPRPPALGRGYLQPKPKPLKTVENTESSENQRSLDSTFSSPVHPTSCSSPISETSGYSSGYESEAASSECPSVDEGSETDREGPQRRVRTKFTPEQINKLEKIFNKHKYLDAGERVKTAQRLNLTETQVRTWFQNRRMKMKREVQDYLTPQVPPVIFQALAPVPYSGMVAQRPHYPAAATHQPYYYPLQMPQMVLQQQMPPHHPPHLILQNPHCY
ncbi:ventral homeobox [Cynoglossus semilaevis]|uniref:Ventral homeobox n=1 Tax=Cynoglossus semilaevis TaxID=244447 RepID=A0A3P8VNN9_CYNSE|nr:homeobox protein pv.1-like [Cynoglossus semilaevis]XP_016892637.1 homeobox protein pv.1-like [Cynoglossus semilaevis]